MWIYTCTHLFTSNLKGKPRSCFGRLQVGGWCGSWPPPLHDWATCLASLTPGFGVCFSITLAKGSSAGWGKLQCPLGLSTEKNKLHLNLEIYRNADQPCCQASYKPALLGALPFVGLKEWGVCCQVGQQYYKQIESPYPTSNLDLVTGRQLV